MQLEAMAEPLDGTGGEGPSGTASALAAADAPRSLWTPALRALWKPSARLESRLHAYARQSQLQSEPYVAMHMRISLADQRDGQRKLETAAACARSRLAAANASHLFLATMYQSNRRALSAALGRSGVRVHWFGRSMEAQAARVPPQSLLAHRLIRSRAHHRQAAPMLRAQRARCYFLAAREAAHQG